MMVTSWTSSTAEALSEAYREQLSDLKRRNDQLFVQSQDYLELTAKGAENLEKTLESIKEKDLKITRIQDALNRKDSVTFAIVTSLKKEIGITNLNANTLESIQDEVEKLKQKQIGISSSENELNDDSIVSNLENKQYILSLTNNARQFKNEFTLIENYEKTNNKFKVEIHKKFTLALACILFTMVGAPLGILVRNGGMTIASGLSIAFFLVYYILLIWGEQLADRSLLNPGLGSWLPNIVLFISGIIVLKLSNAKN